MHIGYIVGEVETHRFTFVTSPERAAARLEYLVVRGVNERVDDELVEVDVLAQVSRLQVASQVLDDTHTYEETQTLVDGQYQPTPRIIGTAEVLGYLYKDSDGRTTVRSPRNTPFPGAIVELAPDDLLRDFFTRNVSSGIRAGTLINRPNVEVALDPNGLRRHLSVIAQTGAGKSYLSGLLLENLLELGGTIIVFDPNSDYVRLRQKPDRTATPFASRVEVYRIPGVLGRRYPDDEIGGSQPYTIWFSKLEPDEVCDLAGVPAGATNIRAAIKKACDGLTREGRDYGPDDLIRRLTKLAGLPQDDESGIGPVPLDMDALEEDEDPFHAAIEERAGVPLKGGRSKSTESKQTTMDVQSGAEKALKYVELLCAYSIWGLKDVDSYLDAMLRPKSVSVVDLAGMEQFIAQYAVQKTLREVWRRATSGNLTHPVFIVIEEAHNFVPGNSRFPSECARWINKIASEGRKFKVFLIVITQRPGKIDPDTLSQCGSQVVMKLTNPEDQNAVRSASESLSGSLFTDLPGLNVGEAIVLGPLTRVPCIIKVGARVSAEGGSDVDVTAELRRALSAVSTQRMEESSPFGKPPKRDRVEEI
jgi:DNA helicase HerA-like ATPase